MLTDEEREIPPYLVPEYLHFLAVWTTLDTFYFKIFCPKTSNGVKSAYLEKNLLSASYYITEILLIMARARN